MATLPTFATPCVVDLESLNAKGVIELKYQTQLTSICAAKHCDGGGDNPVLFISAEASFQPPTKRQRPSHASAARKTLLNTDLTSKTPPFMLVSSYSVEYEVQGTQICITSLSLYIPLLRRAAPTLRHRRHSM